MSRRGTYMAECFHCDWRDPNATSTASARRHAQQTDHTTACAYERDHIYRGRKSSEGGQ